MKRERTSQTRPIFNINQIESLQTDMAASPSNTGSANTFR